MDCLPVDNNKYGNLVIIVYIENDKIFKKCVNLIGYIRSVEECNGKDIFSQKPVTNGTILDLKYLAVQKLTTEALAHSEMLIPEYLINFQ